MYTHTHAYTHTDTHTQTDIHDRYHLPVPADILLTSFFSVATQTDGGISTLTSGSDEPCDEQLSCTEPDSSEETERGDDVMITQPIMMQ